MPASGTIDNAAIDLAAADPVHWESKQADQVDG